MSDIVSVYREAVDMLDRQGVGHVLLCGTLLGCCREGKFIEWDDIDFGVWEDDRNVLNITEWLQDGWSLSREMGSDGRGWEYTLTKDGINVDLFFMRADGESMWFNVGDRVRYRFRLQSFATEPVVFCDQQSFKFVEWESILEQNYGDWRTPRTEWNCYTDARCIEAVRTGLPPTI